jgi:hypothetical protein
MTKAPVHSIRLGMIKASIWRNKSRYGDRHNVTVCRLFKDGDLWRESTHFGRDDLLVLAKVLDFAHTWIHTHAAAADDRRDDGGEGDE